MAECSLPLGVYNASQDWIYKYLENKRGEEVNKTKTFPTLKLFCWRKEIILLQTQPHPITAEALQK